MIRLLMALVLASTLGSALAEGDAERGKTLTATCVACHGDNGNSLAGSFPNIAGQSEKYLLKQLRDMKSGARAQNLMAGMVDGLSDQDLQDLAAYYTAQPAAEGAANPELALEGEHIYRSGIARKGIAACTACHSPTGQGNALATFPRLAGQWAEYTEAQLKAFRVGARKNDGESKMMRLSAMDLSDREIAAVASYLAGLRQ
jgi:cytochrome c553